MLTSLTEACSGAVPEQATNVIEIIKLSKNGTNFKISLAICPYNLIIN